MQTFEIKTHRNGKTYDKPHFFILNKGMGSGRPLPSPCANCFVIITQCEHTKIKLFQLAMLLQNGRYFELYLKGSVIPFIGIKEAKNVLLNALVRLDKIDFSNQMEQLIKIEAYESSLIKQLHAVKNLKIALMRSFDFNQ